MCAPTKRGALLLFRPTPSNAVTNAAQHGHPTGVHPTRGASGRKIRPRAQATAARARFVDSAVLAPADVRYYDGTHIRSIPRSCSPQVQCQDAGAQARAWRPWHGWQMSAVRCTTCPSRRDCDGDVHSTACCFWMGAVPREGATTIEGGGVSEPQHKGDDDVSAACHRCRVASLSDRRSAFGCPSSASVDQPASLKSL